MLIVLAEIEYVPWETYTSKEPTFTTNPNAYDNFAETFYTPYQMYQLQKLQNALTLRIKNESLIDKEADWAKMQQKIQPFFTDLETYRAAAVQLNNEDALVMDINTIGDQFEHEQYETFIQDRLAHGWPNEKDASQEAVKDSSEKYPELLSKYSDKIKQSLAKHNSTDESLYDSMRRYLQLCSFNRIGLDLKARIAYLSAIKETSLTSNEDPCERASLLIWALGAIDSKRGSTTVKNEVIGGIGRHCRFCYRSISKPKKTQSTCGREACTQELSKVQKQEGRKSGRYNMR